MNQELIQIFERPNFSCPRYQHPPLNTCTDADSLAINRSGVRLKNLFLRDNYGRKHILLITAAANQVDLKQLSKQESISRLGFASAERLDKYLAVRPGHVSLLALINDRDHQVELWIDSTIWERGAFQCHPLDNRYTWVLSQQQVEEFLSITAHTPKLLDVPLI